MSIKARIDDSRVLYATGRREGALLSLLVAVAATSRRRYPQRKSKTTPAGMTDREAFTKFMHDEMPAIARVQDLDVKFRGSMIRLEELFYEFVRCELAHEATLPHDVRFERTDRQYVKVDDAFVELSDGWLDSIANAVQNAPENVDLFKDRLSDVDIAVMLGPVVQVVNLDEAHTPITEGAPVVQPQLVGS